MTLVRMALAHGDIVKIKQDRYVVSRVRDDGWLVLFSLDGVVPGAFYHLPPDFQGIELVAKKQLTRLSTEA